MSDSPPPGNISSPMEGSISGTTGNHMTGDSGESLQRTEMDLYALAFDTPGSYPDGSIPPELFSVQRCM
jgi:hypothetical protein